MSCDDIDVSVVLPCYTEKRIENIRAALTSLRKQSLEPAQTIVAVDHNEKLAALIADEFDWVTVVINDVSRGASGTRNRGVAAVDSPVTAFLDDDETADPDWLRQLTAPFFDDTVVGTGGAYEPVWPGAKPRWFPDEFAWAIGGAYPGLPTETAPVRNVWSGNMAIRTQDFRRVGGFRTDFGKNGAISEPEDTDLCIRVTESTGKRWMYVPSAVISHEVPTTRTSLLFFLSRCCAEGAGKAAMRSNLRSDTVLQTEFGYVRHVVSAVLRRLTRFRLFELVQALAMLLGLGSAAVGYLGARFRTAVDGGGRGVASDANEVSGDGRRPAFVADYNTCDGIGEFIDTIVDFDSYVNGAVVVRHDGRPVDLAIAPATADDIRHRITESVVRLTALTKSAVANAAQTGEPAAGAALPTVTVAVCTRERPHELGRLLDSLTMQTRRDFHVLVVDNAPTSSATHDVVTARCGDFMGLDYVVEPRPGLSRARNRAVSIVTTDVIAWIDDDEIADSTWLEQISRGFVEHPDAAALSGSVVPAELETWAQWWFEQYGGHTKGRGFTEVAFRGDDMRGEDPLYPLPAFGVGANMAFRTGALRAIGDFDVALGAGTQTHGGEDTLMFSLLLLRGQTVVYYPAAMTRHFHRPDMSALEKQMFGYGTGLTAFYLALLRHDWRLILPLLRLTPRAIADMSGGRRSAATGGLPADFPTHLLTLKQRGLLYGPLAYLRARSHAARPGSADA